uniref:Uncharacterized protein n=1 Tax=Oryza punctata TaxID=4537 RepID=A0A0E0LXR9_ORYPU
METKRVSPRPTRNYYCLLLPPEKTRKGAGERVRSGVAGGAGDVRPRDSPGWKNAAAALCSLQHPGVQPRRVTLLWTNLLNRSPAPASRSPMQHSNTCNCSSLQITGIFFWNALEMRDSLGIAICFDKRCVIDSNREVVISLASLNSLTTLQSSLSETTFFRVFLGCFFAFFTKPICFDKRCIVDSNREVVISLASLNSLTILHSLSETTFFRVFLECFFAFFTNRMELSHCHVSTIGSKNQQKRNSDLDRFPEQILNSALEINNVQLQRLQLLLLADNSSLLGCLGDKRPLAITRDHNSPGIVVLLHQKPPNPTPRQADKKRTHERPIGGAAATGPPAAIAGDLQGQAPAACFPPEAEANRRVLEWLHLRRIYELRVFRSATLLWIIFLNRSSAPLSRSPMMHSNACNCSSSQTTDLFFWNALETRDILGTTSFCDRWQDVDSSRETASTLALINSLTSLQSSLSEVVFLLIFLHCFCAFLAKWGIGAQVAYELRVFRRETLPWINLLNRSSAPLSSSSIVSSNSCNCSSSHMTLLFWNVPETRYHLGVSIFFDRRQDVDSSNEMVISLASASSFTTLQSILSEAVLLLTFLNRFCAFLASRIFLKPSHIVSMAAEGEETTMFRDEFSFQLSCSSSSIAGMFQLSTEIMTMSYKSWMPIALRQWSIYELRVFRREALVWINLLNRFSAPLSRPTMPNSSACNCTSSHETFAFWNDLEIRDHLLGLQVGICFDKSSSADFRTEAVIPLAVVNRLTSLPSSSESSSSPSSSRWIVSPSVLSCFCTRAAVSPSWTSLDGDELQYR